MLNILVLGIPAEVKKALFELSQTNYSQFVSEAIKLKVPYEEEPQTFFRFYDIHSYNYHEIQQKYDVSCILNASLIPTEREFIAMEYPMDECLGSVDELTRKSNCRVVISLIGERYHWESDFLRTSFQLIRKYTPEEFLEYLNDRHISLADLQYKDIHELVQNENSSFSVEVFYPKNQSSADHLLLYRINCRTWKDKTPPTLEMIKVLDVLYSGCCKLTHTDNPGPVIIHCLAGVGRTGTFVFYTIFRTAVLSGMVSEKDKFSVFIDLFIFLRTKRTWMVESSKQLDFLYKMFQNNHIY